MSRPSDVTEDQAADAVARAREVGKQSAMLHDEAALAKLADPPEAALAVVDLVLSLWLGLKDADAATLAEFVTELAAQLAQAEGPAAEAARTS